MEFLKPEALKIDGDLSENFKYFRDEVDFYFTVTEADKLSIEIQVEILKELLGPKGWDLYCSLSTHVGLDVTVEHILSTLGTHCIPHKCTNMEIFNFLLRKQQWNESFEDFLADLKRLVKLCDFRDQENKLLQYQIVMGVYCSNLQTRLLKKYLTLDEIINIATSNREEENEIDSESEDFNFESEENAHEEDKSFVKISPDMSPGDLECCNCNQDKLLYNIS